MGSAKRTTENGALRLRFLLRERHVFREEQIDVRQVKMGIPPN